MKDIAQLAGVQAVYLPDNQTSTCPLFYWDKP
jgi:hypothetical protein